MLRRSYSFQQQVRPPLSRQRSTSVLSRSSSFVVSAPYTTYSSERNVFSRAPRSYMPSNSYRPPLVQSYGVVTRSPRYSDRYPHIRYSGYAEYTPGLSIIDYSSHVRRSHYTQNLKPFRQYVDHTLSLYSTNAKLSPSYGFSAPRYGTPVRPYVHHLGVDDAVDLYKKRCMTSSALVKYWLTPTKMELRREREMRDMRPLNPTTYECPRSRRTFSSRLTA